MSELKSCPFCGHEENEVTGEPGFYEILCDGCDHACFSYFHTKAMAIAAWNTRVSPVEVKPDAHFDDFMRRYSWHEQGEWTPVEDGAYHTHGNDIIVDGNLLGIAEHGKPIYAGALPDELRLCHKRPAAEA